MSPQDVLQSGFDFKKSKIQPTHPLRPVQTDNTRPFRFTAAAGTEFAGASFQNLYHSLVLKMKFTTRRPSIP